MPDSLDFRTPEWLAEQLDIDKNAVYRYLNEGVLPGLQLGRKWLISESTVIKFLKAEEERQTAERRQMSGARFDRFTEVAREVMFLARDIARHRHHNWIGTEHLLLALLDQGNDAVQDMLAGAGGTPSAVREALEGVMARFKAPAAVRDALEGVMGRLKAPTAGKDGDIGLTPRAKKSIDLAVKEAEAFHGTRVGPEHLLVGLVAIGEGIAAEVLKELGVTTAALRRNLATRSETSPDGPSTA